MRTALQEATGRESSFGWFFRMDPQIASAYGDAGHLVHTFGGTVGRLQEAGDHRGAHTHLRRWSEPHDAWVHDLHDRTWVRDGVEAALSSFADVFGIACTRHRSGAGLFNQALADALERGGVLVESGLERGPFHGRRPGNRPRLRRYHRRPADCSRAPRRPYHPMTGDFTRTGPTGGLTMLPHTTTRLSPLRPAWQSWGRWIAVRRRPPVRCMYPWIDLPPFQYRDWLGRQLKTMRRPHANIAIRTNDPESAPFQRTKAILEARPTHPIASRIVLVDRLDVVGGAGADG